MNKVTDSVVLLAVSVAFSGCFLLQTKEKPRLSEAIQEANAIHNPVTTQKLDNRVRAEEPFALWAYLHSYEREGLCVDVQFAHYMNRDFIKKTKFTMKGLLTEAEERTAVGIDAKTVQILGDASDNIDTRICFEGVAQELSADKKYLVIRLDTPRESHMYLVWELMTSS